MNDILLYTYVLPYLLLYVLTTCILRLYNPPCIPNVLPYEYKKSSQVMRPCPIESF